MVVEEASDGVPNIDELKTYFLSNSFDLNKLPELLHDKYGVKGVGTLADSQVGRFLRRFTEDKSVNRTLTAVLMCRRLPI